jgi:hypothetical protein
MMSSKTWFSEQLWHKKTDAEDAAQADIFRAYADERLVADDDDDPDKTLALADDETRAAINAQIEAMWKMHDQEEREQ